MSNRITRLREGLLFGLLLLLPLGLCWRPLREGNLPDFMDPVMYFFPLRWHAARLVLDGQMPWWNRCILNGAPLFANPQAALGYPFTWPMLLWPGGTAYTAPLLAQLGLFAGATFLLLRRMGASVAASFLSGSLILSGSYAWTRLQLGNFMNVLPWWPLWLMAGIAFARRPGSSSLTGGTLAVAMMILAGAHQLAIYGAMGLALALLPLLGGPDRRRWLGFGAGSAAMGLLVAGPGWLPQLAFLRETSRAGGLDPSSVLVGTLATPLEVVRELTGTSSDAGSSLSIGAFALVMAGTMPADTVRRRFWVGAWLAAMTTAIMAWRPVASLALEVIPGYGAFHDPRRILGMTQWLLVLAAGLGADALISVKAARGARGWAHMLPVAAILGGVLLARGARAPGIEDLPLIMGLAFVGAMLVLPGESGEGRFKALRTGLATIFFLAAALHLARETARTVDMSWRSAAELVGEGPPELLKAAALGPGERFFAVDWKRDSSYDFRRPDLRPSALPNLAMLWGLEDIGGYEPARTPRYDRWLASAAPWPGGRQPWRDWFGLPFPPPPGTGEFLLFAEANPRLALIPRWGLPTYLFAIDGRRAGGLLPAWKFGMNLHLLYRPAEAASAERSILVVDEWGKAESLAFRPDRQIAASFPLLGFPKSDSEAGIIQADPALQVQVLSIERGPGAGHPAGFELRLPPSELPAWAFLWSPDLTSAYLPEAEFGLHARAKVLGTGGWAVLHASSGRAGTGEVLRKTIEANRMELRVRWDGDETGTVRIHDAWWPGWRAWVNGEPAEVVASAPEGAGLWREVSVSPGESDILLTYEPPLLRASLWGSCLGLVLLIGVGWMIDHGRESRGGEEPDVPLESKR